MFQLVFCHLSNWSCVTGTPPQEWLVKPSIKAAQSTNAVIGRYILPRTIFKKLKSLKPVRGTEIHITDAIQQLINDKEKFVAHNFEGKYLDCGTMKGYINSSKVIGRL